MPQVAPVKLKIVRVYCFSCSNALHSIFSIPLDYYSKYDHPKWHLTNSLDRTHTIKRTVPFFVIGQYK